ncbi:MAG: PAS domain-containing protein, partial [Clostridia bacterium]
PGGVIQCSSDETCEFIYMSDGFIDMLGYSRTEIRHQFKNSFWNTVHPDDVASIREQIYSNLTPGGTLELQYRSITNSGNTMWIL